MTESKPVIAVLGLGRTGLPVALVAAAAGFEVLGIDIDSLTIERLLAGECPFEEDGMAVLLRRTLGTSFKCILLDSVGREEWARVGIVLIHFGLSLEEVTRSSSARFGPFETVVRLGVEGKTIVLRTTVPVGFTRKLSLHIEQLTGLKEGRDFFVAYVPERLFEGRAVVDAASLPHVIGALSSRGYAQTLRLFGNLGGGRTIAASSAEVAEAVKLAENAWRDTTFSFANDLAMLCDNVGIDVFEVIRVANTDYSWNNIPWPGPVSGYCLKKDPLVLAASEKDGMDRLWVHGRRSNELLPETIGLRVMESGVKKVLIAGLSFKKDTDDFRDSHSLDLLRLFKSKGFEVAGCDPFLQTNTYTRLPANMEIEGFKSIREAAKWLKEAAIVLATPHSFFRTESEFNALLANKPRLLVDMWGLWREMSEAFEQHGICYASIGSGKFWARKPGRRPQGLGTSSQSPRVS